MAKYRAQRGLGHLLSLSLFRGSMPIPGPGSDTGGNLSVAENILSLVFDHNFTIDCIDVRPARCVKLQDMKQFPIKPDCAPTPSPAQTPPPRLRHCKNNKLSYLQSRGQSKWTQDGSALRGVWPGSEPDSQGLNIRLRSSDSNKGWRLYGNQLHRDRRDNWII